MKIAFFSNFLNHHQLPFCQAMCQRIGGEFTFVASEPTPQERLDLGYHNMNNEYAFVLRAYDGEEAELQAERLARECDVVIIGSAPEKFVQIRMGEGKLTFRYSERLYKHGYIHIFSPRGRKNMVKFHTKYNDRPLYMLCASNYTAFDYALSGAYVGKNYKWGYFPEFEKCNIEELFAEKSKKEKLTVLWAGRLINWKHPEAAIKVARKLKKTGKDFEMNIIGSGIMEKKITELICRYKLSDCVHMLGAMSPEKVRQHMRKSDIFLFTSDYQEGWGAVLNEAMSAGCAVVASHAIGSAGFLLQNGKNGIIYRHGNQRQMNQAVITLMDNPQWRESVGRQAYKTIVEEWNADAAAERFIQLCEAIQAGKPTPFEDGPCSRAKTVSNYQASRRVKSRILKGPTDERTY